MWNEQYFGASARRACREEYQAWLLAQTERISSAAESGDLRSLVRLSWIVHDRSPSSPYREGPSPVEVPAVADVQAALEPLTGLLKMVKATAPTLSPTGGQDVER